MEQVSQDGGGTHRLPEAHLVGEDAVEVLREQRAEPLQRARLVRKESSRVRWSCQRRRVVVRHAAPGYLRRNDINSSRKVEGR